MRRCLSTAAVLCVAAFSLAIPSSPAVADELGLPQSLTAQGSRPNFTRVEVPHGVTPRLLRGLLSVENADDGRIRISIHGRVVSVVPAVATQWVRLPISSSDMETDGTVSVGLEYVAPVRNVCDATRAPVLTSLSRLQVVFSGRESAPSKVADFLPGAASRIDVVLPESADDYLVEAGLTAVAALSRTYPAPIPVVLSPDTATLPHSGAGHRVIRFARKASETVTSTVDVRGGTPTLTISGDGPALVDAARALGAQGLAMADDATVENLSLSAAASDLDTQTSLADLGSETLRLSGWGRSDAYVGIAQDEFGGPIESLDLELVGIHTAVKGVNAQVDVYLNDVLVASTILGYETDFHLPIHVDSDLLRSDNGLQLVLTAIPEDGRCGAVATHPPVLLDIDGAKSKITAVRGAGRLGGFELYPQVFGGDVPVALRDTSRQPLGDAVHAAALLSALQRAATQPLTVRLVSPEELIGGHDSGLLVGASYDDSVQLEAPLRLAGMRLIDFAEATFQMGSNQPFAALESVRDGDRHILMLGGWHPDTDLSGDELEGRAVDSVARTGWRAQREDLLIATSTGAPFNLSTNSVLPQADRVDEQRSMVWWLLGGVAVLGVVLLLQLGLSSRRQRAARDLVRAQQSAGHTGQSE